MDRKAGEKLLAQLLDAQVDDGGFWLKLSYVAEPVLGRQAALRACQTALRCSGTDSIEYRHRTAHLLEAAGKHAAALGELEKIAASGRDHTQAANALAELAFRCGSPGLAARFTKTSLAANRTDINIHIAYIEYLVAAGEPDSATSEIEEFLTPAHRALPVTLEQCGRLIRIARSIGYLVERRAIFFAAKKYPADPEIEMLVQRDAFAMKFYGNSSAAAPVSKAPQKRGLLTRLGLARRQPAGGVRPGRSPIGGLRGVAPHPTRASPWTHQGPRPLEP